ncbi:hypothetical protein LT493_11270 [Streptomyces tricolor]|nr:hypothetical protein [Streptomyces tricolor]
MASVSTRGRAADRRAAPDPAVRRAAATAALLSVAVPVAGAVAARVLVSDTAGGRHRHRGGHPGQRAARRARVQRAAAGRARLPRARDAQAGRRRQGGQGRQAGLRPRGRRTPPTSTRSRTRTPPTSSRRRPRDIGVPRLRRRLVEKDGNCSTSRSCGPGQGTDADLRQAADPALRGVPSAALARRRDQQDPGPTWPTRTSAGAASRACSTSRAPRSVWPPATRPPSTGPYGTR